MRQPTARNLWDLVTYATQAALWGKELSMMHVSTQKNDSALFVFGNKLMKLSQVTLWPVLGIYYPVIQLHLYPWAKQVDLVWCSS